MDTQPHILTLKGYRKAANITFQLEEYERLKALADAAERNMTYMLRYLVRLGEQAYNNGERLRNEQKGDV